MRKTRNRVRIGRNERCPCGSGSKFKYCHGRRSAAPQQPYIQQYIDTGEDPIRWVISSVTGTAFFVDAAGRILVFPTREMAQEITKLELFADHEDGEINVSGVGPTKWAHLQATLPFVEVESAAQAAAFIAERLAAQAANNPEPEHTESDTEKSQEA